MSVPYHSRSTKSHRRTCLRLVVLLLFLESNTGAAFGLKPTQRDCKEFWYNLLVADRIVWPNRFGELLLCADANCIRPKHEVWVNGSLSFETTRGSPDVQIDIELSEGSLNIVSVFQLCLDGSIIESRLHILALDATDRSAASEVVTGSAGRIQIFRVSDVQASAAPVGCKHQRNGGEGGGGVAECAIVAFARIKLNKFYFDVFLHSADLQEIADVAYRAMLLYQFEGQELFTIMSMLQQQLWDLLLDKGNQSAVSTLPRRRTVVLSSDANPIYAFCLPVAALFWQRVVGFNATILLVGDAWSRTSLDACSAGECAWMRSVRSALDDVGAETIVLGGSRHKSALVAQVCRLYAAMRRVSRRDQDFDEEDEYLLISDADLLPLSKEAFLVRNWGAFVHMMNAFEGPKFKVARSRAEGRHLEHDAQYEEARGYLVPPRSGYMTMFPMSYVGALSGRWRRLMMLPSRSELDDWWRQTGNATGQGSREADVDAGLSGWIDKRLDADFGGNTIGEGGGYVAHSKQGESAWWYDQRLLALRLQTWAWFPGRAELVKRDTQKDRVNRGAWRYSAGRGGVYVASDRWRVGQVLGLSRRKAVDAHVPLPLYGNAVWGSITPMLRAMLPPADVAWLAAWRTRFREALASNN